MFIARWTTPKWRNIAVTRRHGWPPRVSGPKLAPSETISGKAGPLPPPPSPSSSKKKAILAAMRPYVTKGRHPSTAGGASGGAGRLEGAAGSFTKELVEGAD